MSLCNLSSIYIVLGEYTLCAMHDDKVVTQASFATLVNIVKADLLDMFSTTIGHIFALFKF